MEPIVAGLVAAAVLGLLWLTATRRHAQRRRARDADWEAGAAKPELWTSGARCPNCRQRGGVLELVGEEVWFVCLSCGQRHMREHRG